MAGRGTSSGRGKRAKGERAGRAHSAPYQRRIDRDHGGCPTHLRDKPSIDETKRRLIERAVVAAKAHKRSGIPAAALRQRGDAHLAPIDVIGFVSASGRPIMVPRLADPDGQSDSSVPAVAIYDDREDVPAPALRIVHPAPRARARRLGFAMLAVPLAAAIALVLMRPSPPAPAINSPQSVITATPRTDAAIRQRILEMTPAIRLPPHEPAMPGSIQFAALSLPSAPPDIPAIVASPLPSMTTLPRWDPPPLPLVVTGLPPALAPEPTVTRPIGAVEPADGSPAVVAVDAPVEATGELAHQCSLNATMSPPDLSPLVPAVPEAGAFGPVLAAAALVQIQNFVVYDARYSRIAFPGGDVASLHGVCTDVVIRAYRALGIDLQRIVSDSRVGVGDTNIDHRRTETLRRFFAVHGETLPTSAFAEDYEAGDIVTYHRPQNRISTAHIAIVSDQIGPSRRPMIIHNRGNGVQLEDALFVDRITGHYRYTGPKEPLSPLAVAARPRPVIAAAPSTLRAVMRPVQSTPVTSSPVPSNRLSLSSGSANAVQAGPVMGSAGSIVRAAARSPAAHKLALRTGGAVVPAGLPGARVNPTSPLRSLQKSP